MFPPDPLFACVIMIAFILSILVIRRFGSSQPIPITSHLTEVKVQPSHPIRIPDFTVLPTAAPMLAPMFQPNSDNAPPPPVDPSLPSDVELIGSPRLQEIREELMQDGVGDFTLQERLTYFQSLAFDFNQVGAAEISLRWLKAKTVAKGYMLCQMWGKKVMSFSKWCETLVYFDEKLGRIKTGMSIQQAYKYLAFEKNKKIIQDHFGENPEQSINDILKWVQENANRIVSVADALEATEAGKMAMGSIRLSIERQQNRPAPSRKPVVLTGYPDDMGSVLSKCRELYEAKRLGEPVMKEILGAVRRVVNGLNDQKLDLEKQLKAAQEQIRFLSQPSGSGALSPPVEEIDELLQHLSHSPSLNRTLPMPSEVDPSEFEINSKKEFQDGWKKVRPYGQTFRWRACSPPVMASDDDSVDANNDADGDGDVEMSVTASGDVGIGVTTRAQTRKKATTTNELFD